MAADLQSIRKGGTQWVQDTARAKDLEARRAGNPEIRLITINGKISTNHKSFTGFRAGSIEQANNSVKIQYVGKELYELAQKIKPLLEHVIEETYPDSKTKRLARGWEWLIQRFDTPGRTGGSGVQRVGGRVPVDVSIYDVLWLVPKGPFPADYVWFANAGAKKKFGYKYNIFRKSITSIDSATGLATKKKVARLRKRMKGFAGETSRRARGAKGPGLNVSAMHVQHVLIAGDSRAKWGVPVIRVSFKQHLNVAVPL